MVRLIRLEIVAVPAEQSRGRHNPRVVKRKMSSFPTKARAVASSRPVFRSEEHIRIVAPVGRLEHVQSWRASGRPRIAYCQDNGLSPRAFHQWVAHARMSFRRKSAPNPNGA
jgi:hypothetical protein